MICDSSYKTVIGLKPLRISFDKIDGFTRIYDRTRCLTLFGSEKYDAIYNRIISLRSGVACISWHYFVKIKGDSYDSLFIEKRLTLHSFIILIKTVLNKDKNHFYYKILITIS